MAQVMTPVWWTVRQRRARGALEARFARYMAAPSSRSQRLFERAMARDRAAWPSASDQLREAIADGRLWPSSWLVGVGWGDWPGYPAVRRVLA